VPVVLTIQTTAPSATIWRPIGLPSGFEIRAAEFALFCVLGACVFLLCARRRKWSLALAALAFVAVALSMSCGGGGGGGGGGQTNPGTTPGYYPGLSITVTINGATQSISNLAVEVESVGIG
jgi:hypothetical protein